jgi:hypothetical protein
MITFILVAIFRTSKDEKDLEEDNKDDGLSLNKSYKEDQSVFYENDNLINNEKILNPTCKPLDQLEIEEARHYRLIEIKMWKLIKELFLYSLFIWILFVVSYSNKDINSYSYMKSLKDLFILGNSKIETGNFMQVSD